MNYLRPDIRRGNITAAEDDLIMRLHSLLGNRWSLIAGRLPGRTDNEIKNYWNTHPSKKLRSQGTNPGTQREMRKATKHASQAKRQKSDAAAAKTSGGKGSNCRRREKPKVHLPKAVRVTTAFPHAGNMLHGGGEMEREDPWTGWDDEGDGQEGKEKKSRRRQGGLGLGEVQREDEGGLEKLYEEYLEVLRAGQEDPCHLPELDS